MWCREGVVKQGRMTPEGPNAQDHRVSVRRRTLQWCFGVIEKEGHVDYESTSSSSEGLG